MEIKNVEKNLIYHGIGRRKSAIARVFLFPGSGNILINNKNIENHFNYILDQKEFIKPLSYVKYENSFDVYITVKGGGRKGQVNAIKLGLARAICLIDSTKRNILKQQGWLRRDSRIKERRKYGLKKARKAPQYSKR